MALRVVLLIAIGTVFFSGVAYADDAPKLPGSSVTINDAASKADIIVVGMITKGGMLDQVGARPLPGPLYHGVEVKVSQILRGSGVGNKISVSIQVSGFEHETMAAIGGTFIFFGTKDDEKRWVSYTVLKLVPATDANIALVKKLISN